MESDEFSSKESILFGLRTIQSYVPFNCNRESVSEGLTEETRQLNWLVPTTLSNLLNDSVGHNLNHFLNDTLTLDNLSAS